MPRDQMGSTEPTAPRKVQPLNLYDYLAVIRRHIWWGLLPAVILFGTIVLYTFYWATPIYRASALLEIEAAYSVLSLSGTMTFPKLETHIQLIKSPEILFKAMQELGLVSADTSPQETRIKNFAKSLTVTKLEGTSLLQVNYDHPDPAQACRIVNTIAKVYLPTILENKTRKTKNQESFIENQLDELTRQLNNSEAKLQEMKLSGQDTKKTELLAERLAELELETLKQSGKLGSLNPTVLALQEEMTELKKQMKQLSPNDLIYLRVLREKKLNEDLYNLLNTSLRKLQIESVDETIPVRVVNWALVPAKPFKPDRKTFLICGGLLCLLIGVTLIFLRQALDLSLDTPEAVEEYLKMPVVVAIPRIKKLPAQPLHTGAGSSDEKDLMERLRLLGTKLPRASSKGVNLAFVSPGKNSGKTTLSAYYGLTAAEDGKNVLLIDLDTRHPRLHKRLNRPQKPGIVDILRDGLVVSEVIQRLNLPEGTGEPKPINYGLGELDLIPAGSSTASPLKLIDSPRFLEFLNSVRNSYDLILYDTAPLLIASEVLPLLAKIDGYFIVHQPGRLDRYILGRFQTLLRGKLENKCLGVILNNYRYPGPGYYHYYHYYGHNSGDAI